MAGLGGLPHSTTFPRLIPPLSYLGSTLNGQASWAVQKRRRATLAGAVQDSLLVSGTLAVFQRFFHQFIFSLGQPLSYPLCEDAGRMKTENGVLEYWSDGAGGGGMMCVLRCARTTADNRPVVSTNRLTHGSRWLALASDRFARLAKGCARAVVGRLALELQGLRWEPKKEIRINLPLSAFVRVIFEGAKNLRLGKWVWMGRKRSVSSGFARSAEERLQGPGLQHPENVRAHEFHFGICELGISLGLGYWTLGAWRHLAFSCRKIPPQILIFKL